ncbi:MAG: FAD-dependent oxidoreductase [Myxococcota bacterium]
MTFPPVTAPRVAIIGGGLAGLTCARVLHHHGVDAQIFDKARKPGGRLSTRHTDRGLTFDHGAQYFTIRNPWFRRALAPLVEAGTVARFRGRIAVAGPAGIEQAGPSTERWVGVPTMSALPRALAEGLSVHPHARIESLSRTGERWSLRAEDGRQWGGFDRVAITIPAGQAAALLTDLPALQQVAATSPMRPCWAAMLTFDQPASAGYDAAFVQRSPLSWVMRQPSKPQRPPTEAWVLHASPEWTEAHWDAEPSWVVDALVDAWRDRGGPDPSWVVDALAHRWRYALVDPQAAPRALGDDRAGVTLAGDWLGGGRVEGAFLSGRRAAAGLLRSLRHAL